MPRFSKTSLDRLSTCHPDLQRLLHKVVEGFDCAVLQGHRGEADQNAAFARGASKVRYPYGKHNAVPSRAVDVAPWPIDFEDKDRLNLFAGYVMGVGAAMGIPLRWGGDWNRDTHTSDNSFDDLSHFELTEATP